MKYLKTVLLLAVCFGLVFTAPVTAQDKAAEIDSLMKKYHEVGKLNGSVLVAENGKVIFKKGYGFANMEWEIPNAPDTKFRLGSVTKQFTSMLIMQLVQDGKVELDAPMTRYLKDYRKDTGDKVTVHMLLCHTSGIPSYTGLPRFFQDISRDPYPVDEFVKKYCSGDLEFEPGSKYRYNNSGYFLLGAIIEKVTGKTYEAVLKEKILDPLGMKDTGYDHHADILKNRAAAYEKRMNGYINAPYLDMGLPYAAGSLYSTVEDLYIWDQALYAQRLISPDLYKKMFTPNKRNYAYGWVIRENKIGEKKKKVIGHGGGINGFNTLITRIVEDKHLVVILNNTGGTQLGAMTLGIGNILYGLPAQMPKKSIAEVIFKTISKKGVDAAIKQYRTMKEKHADAFDLRERELNNLGYLLLNEKKIDEAIAVFKLNVEAFPKSANVYDSLAEAYMNKGEKELSIKFYKKSLELNPKNKNAEDMIKKMQKKK